MLRNKPKKLQSVFILCETYNAYKIMITDLAFKDALPVLFRSELFTCYILTIFRQSNQLPLI